MTPDNTLRITGREAGDHLRMLQTPDAWPLGGVLTLIRRRDPEIPEEGLVFAVPGIERTRVYLANVFEVPNVPPSSPETLVARLGELRSLGYATFEEMLEAGWTVD